MDGPDAPDAVGPAPGPQPGGGRRRRWPYGLAAALLALGGAAGWAIGTESGLHAIVALAERALAGTLRIEGAEGRLAGPLRIARIAYDAPDIALHAADVALDWQASALLRGRLQVRRLAAARLDLRLPAGTEDAAPATAPASLALPVDIDVAELALVEFALRRGDDETPGFAFSDLKAALNSAAGRHSVRDLQVRFPFGAASFDGEIAATHPFALSARASLTGRQAGQDFQIDAQAGGDLLAPRLQADLSGALAGRIALEATPFADLPLRTLQVKAGAIDPSAFAAEAPTAALQVEAALTAQAAADAAGGLHLVGPLRIVNARPGTLDTGALPVESVAGELDWSAAAVGLRELDLRLAGGGRVGGALSWTPSVAAGGGDFGRLQANLTAEGIALRGLDGRLPQQHLAGSLDAEADAQRQTAKLKLRAAAARVEVAGERQVEAGGEAAFTLSALLRDVDPRAVYPGAPQARLNLDLDASGRLGGVAGAPPQVAARFRLPEGRLEGRPLRGEGRFSLEARDTGPRLTDVAIALDVAGNRLDAKGAWGAARDRLNVSLDAPALGALGYGLGGRVRADAELGGGQQAPSGRFQLAASQLQLPGGVRVAGVNASGSLAEGPRGALALAVGVSGVGKAGVDAPWVEALRLGMEGRVDAHRIELSAEGVAEHRLRVALDGGLKQTAAAGWQWAGRLDALQSEGPVALRLRAPAALSAGPAGVELAAAEFAAGETGHLRLAETRWSPTAGAFRGSLSGLSFGLVRRADGRPRRGPGPLVLGAEWDLRLADTVDGEARLFRESGDLTVSGEIPTRLGLDAFEARLVARANRLSASLEASGSELGKLSGSATAALERDGSAWRLAGQAPLLGSARLDMPSIAWLGRLMRENVETGGQLEGAFTLAGTPDAPQAAGRIRGRELRVALVDQGLILSGGELVADFDHDALRLERLAFVSPNRVKPRESRIPLERLTATPGSLDASGQIALASGAGAFSFSADRLPILQRSDRWLILSGKGEAKSTWTTLALDADLRADAGYVEIAESLPPSLSDDVVVLGAEEPAAGGLAVTSDVRVALGDALYLSALGVETRLGGALRLRQQPGRPLAAVGSVSTVGGSYKGYGQRLAIERGLVNFQGPLDDPGLNIVALRKGLAVEAGVAITGSARRPQVRLVSEPAVPDPEKLSWIVLGRAPDASGGGDLALLLPAAQALLGGPGGGMTEQLSRSLGFDAFSIGQGELNSTSRTSTSRVAGGGTTIASGPTVAGQVLSVGKRLSTDLFLSFEQSLGGAESLVKLTYQLGRRVSVVARGGTDNALDVYYTFAFR